MVVQLLPPLQPDPVAEETFGLLDKLYGLVAERSDLAGPLRAVLTEVVRRIEEESEEAESPEARFGQRYCLTDRELEIVLMLPKGMTNRQIGRQLFIEEHTVKFHLSNAYRKLGVATRTQAATLALSAVPCLLVA